MSNKIQLPSRAKAEAVGTPPPIDKTDAGIVILARKWAALHAKPKTRDQMDSVLVGLDEATARKVVLCGQRIAAGLPPKVAQ